MPVKLTEQETKELLRFRYSAQFQPESATRLGELLVGDQMRIFLDKIEAEINAPDLRVAASVFTKRFAFVAVIYLYALSVWNKRLHFSLDSLFLENTRKEGNWLPEYYFEDLSAEEFTGENRNEWRDEALQYLFKDNIYPFLDSLSKKGEIPKFILWENIAVYIMWLYGNVLEDRSESSVKDDFDYITNQASGHLFGPYRQNPLQRYNETPIFIEELNEFVRIRKTCCFSYRLGEARTYCKTCPLYCKQFNTRKRNRS